MSSRDGIGDDTDRSHQVDEIKQYLSPEDEKLVTESQEGDGYLRDIWMTLGRIVPRSLRYHALNIELSAGKREVAPGEEIPIEVTITNRAPITIPVSLNCGTFWGWAIDGFHEGTNMNLYTSHSKTVGVRGHQTYSLLRTWTGYIEHQNGSERRFEPLSEGEHSLEAWINIPKPERFGLRDSISIEVRR